MSCAAIEIRVGNNQREGGDPGFDLCAVAGVLISYPEARAFNTLRELSVKAKCGFSFRRRYLNSERKMGCGFVPVI